MAIALLRGGSAARLMGINEAVRPPINQHARQQVLDGSEQLEPTIGFEPMTC